MQSELIQILAETGVKIQSELNLALGEVQAELKQIKVKAVEDTHWVKVTAIVGNTNATTRWDTEGFKQEPSELCSNWW